MRLKALLIPVLPVVFGCGVFSGCAGKGARPQPASTRMNDSAPERRAATANALTRGASEQEEERFGTEAARAERDARKKREQDRSRVDVVEPGDPRPRR